MRGLLYIPICMYIKPVLLFPMVLHVYMYTEKQKGIMKRVAYDIHIIRLFEYRDLLMFK